MGDGEYGPRLIYMPRKEILIKLMRACIQVKTEKELWFGNDF